jgi:hypothetical protein
MMLLATETSRQCFSFSKPVERVSVLSGDELSGKTGIVGSCVPTWNSYRSWLRAATYTKADGFRLLHSPRAIQCCRGTKIIRACSRSLQPISRATFVTGPAGFNLNNRMNTYLQFACPTI